MKHGRGKVCLIVYIVWQWEEGERSGGREGGRGVSQGRRAGGEGGSGLPFYVWV